MALKKAKAAATSSPKPRTKPVSFAAVFKKEVVEASKAPGTIVLVKYSADWCSPCKVFAPVLKRFVADLPNVVLRVYDIDRPELMEHAAKQNISAIPAVHLYVKGRQVATRAGTLTRKELMAMVAPYLPDQP